MTKGPSPSDVEIRRRKLKSSDPELYGYIKKMEASKALEDMADNIGSNAPEVANRLYRLCYKIKYGTEISG